VITDVEERAIDGEFGQILVNGVVQQNIQDFTGTLSIEQRTLKVAGSNRQVYRRGMVTRSGSFTWLKVDSSMEAYFENGYASLDPNTRRQQRASGVISMPDLSISILLDDPESWGAEQITLSGAKLWALPLGYTNTAMLSRNITCTWDTETINAGVPRPGNTYGFAPPQGQQTWPAAGSAAAPLI
jgi:hypothetical protein